MDEVTENIKLEVNIPDSQPFEEEELEEEKETLPETSTDEKPDETKSTEETPVEEVVDDTEPELNEPKPVEGETIKERALRKEVEKLRGKLRKERAEELIIQKEQPIAENTSLDDYDPLEVEKLDKILAARGYIKKEEIEKKTYDEIALGELDEFLKSHPEYDDDSVYKQFQDELSVYAKPQNPKKYKELFDRVHKTIFGDNVVKQNVAAANEKLKVASHGSATVTKPNTKSAKVLDQKLKEYLQGYSDDELIDMFGN